MVWLLWALLHRRTRKKSLVVAVSLLALNAVRTRNAVADAHAQMARLGVLPRVARCGFDGEVSASPVRRGRADRLVVDLRGLTCDGREIHAAAGARVALTVTTDEVLARGDQVAGVADLSPPDLFWNEELADPWVRLARTRVARSGGALVVERVGRGWSVGALVDHARAHVRGRIDATFPPLAAPMARALVLGESDLAPEDDDAFRTSGLSHLLAVSGMHLVLVVVSFERALALALRRVTTLAARLDVARVAAAVAIGVTWLYADFAGGSGSAVRAAFMLSVGLLARAAGRASRASRALGLSTLVAALVTPLSVFDVSFALSLAATAGLMGLGPHIARALTAESSGPAWLAAAVRAVGASLAASIACAPLVLGLGPSVPLGGLFANLIAVPLGEVAALPLCMLHALLGFAPPLERGCAMAASGALLAVRAVARAVASAPWTSLPLPPPTPSQLVAAGCAIVAVVVGVRKRRAMVILIVSVSVIVAGELAARHAGAPRGVLRVTTLDVGQGDAHLIDLPDGSLMMIDAGGLVGSPVDVGARAIAPILRARRRNVVDVVVLSHPHPDHYGGFATGTAAVRVGELWDTGQSALEGARGALAARDAVLARGARLRGPDDLCGPHALGGAVVEVLAPCPGVDPDRGPNDNSFVLRIRHGERSFLFVGDAEREAEARVMAAATHASLRADVLKIGHHGSATSSSPGFVAAVSPRVAIVSVGARNRFGHPRAETLATLAAAGVEVLRTDREGAISVTTDGVAIRVVAASGRAAVLYSGGRE